MIFSSPTTYVDILLENPQWLKRKPLSAKWDEKVTLQVVKVVCIKWGYLNWDKPFLNVVAQCLRNLGIFQCITEKRADRDWSVSLGYKVSYPTVSNRVPNRVPSRAPRYTPRSTPCAGERRAQPPRHLQGFHRDLQGRPDATH